MFKKFSPESDVSTSTQVKASVQRAVKSQILERHPAITEEMLDALLPKKDPLVQYKVGPHMVLYCRRRRRRRNDKGELIDEFDETEDNDDDDEKISPTDEPLFFQKRDGPILPTLKLVHRFYPTLRFTQVTVDKGAIPYLLGGANVMCPGLTNPGGEMPPDGVEKDKLGFDKPGLNEGDGVVIFAEGKEYALGIGIMLMSSTAIRERNKGLAIELLHYLGDGLYATDEI